jgi:tetratricopeptide (TPR) repeat protein
MVGLFELFTEQKRNKEAYEVVRTISRYFPANPDRLASVLRLAVVNEAFEDIERYYHLFTKLDHRNEMLVRYVCAALLVCGKYYLQKRENTRAVELFSKAKASGARNPKLMREIISALAQYELYVEAEEFLRAFPAEAQGSDDYVALKFAVGERLLPDGESIAQGRELVKRGVQDPLLYLILIRKSLKVGYADHAAELVQHAVRLWPAREAEFRALLNPSPKRVA